MTIETLIGLAAVAVPAIAWLIRLESQSLTNKRDIDRLEKALEKQQTQLDTAERQIGDKLGRIENCLARIEEQLKHTKGE